MAAVTSAACARELER